MSPHPQAQPSIHETARLRRLASSVSLAMALALIGAKLWAWWVTDSIALLSSAVDAGVDALAALATFAGVRFALRPADPEHRFGHGKGEALPALFQALILAAAGAVLAYESIRHLIAPEQLDAIAAGIWVSIAGLAAASGLVLLQSRVLARSFSLAIAADRAHYQADIAMNAAVLAALTITAAFGWRRADPAFALAISGYMLWCSRKVAIGALDRILDRELGPNVRRRIREAVLSIAEVRGVHDIRTRDAGDRIFVEFHIELDGGLTVAAGHAIADAAESAVASLFGEPAEVIAHVEPAGIRDRRLDDRVHPDRPGCAPG